MKNEPCMCGAADCPKCHPGCHELLRVGCKHGEARRWEVTGCYLCGRLVCVECGVCVECNAAEKGGKYGA